MGCHHLGTRTQRWLWQTQAQTRAPLAAKHPQLQEQGPRARAPLAAKHPQLNEGKLDRGPACTASSQADLDARER